MDFHKDFGTDELILLLLEADREFPRFEVAAETAHGPRVKSYVAPDNRRKTSEYPLLLEGAKILRQLRITLENPEPVDAIFKWVLIADSRRRADLDRMYRELDDIDCSLYIKGERGTVPTFANFSRSSRDRKADADAVISEACPRCSSPSSAAMHQQHKHKHSA